MAVTKILALDGLNDAKTTQLLQKLIASMPGVQSAKLDFLTQKLVLEISSDDATATINEVVEMLKSVDPHIEVKRKEVISLEPEPVKADPYGLRSGVRFEYPEEEEPEEEAEKGADAEKPNAERKIAQVNMELILRAAVLLVEGAAFVVSLLVGETLSYILALAAFLIAAVYVLSSAISAGNRNMVAGAVFTTLAGAVLFFTENREVAAGAMLVYQAGAIAVMYIQRRFQTQLDSLIDIHPDYVYIKQEEQLQQVPLEQVAVGDYVVVRPGDTIPFDGLVVEGTSEIDASLFTGDSEPLIAEPEGEVYCGTVNKTDFLTIEVTREQRESEASRMMEMLHDTGKGQTALGKRAHKLETILTLSIAAIAAAIAVLPPLLSPTEFWTDWINPALLFLAIASPCGAGVTVGFAFSGIVGGALKERILIRGGQCVEAAARAGTVFCGLRGILTQGQYKVVKLLPKDITEQQLLEYAAFAECKSRHPVAKAIVDKYHEVFLKEIDPKRLAVSEAVKGYGGRCMIDRKTVIAGSRKFMRETNVEVPAISSEYMVVYVSVRGAYVGALYLEDQVKPGALRLARQLKELGVGKVDVLTGCDGVYADKTALLLGADEVFAELEMDEKLFKLREAMRGETPAVVDEEGNVVQPPVPLHPLPVVFAGDAKDDRVLLANADVGIAIGDGTLSGALDNADIAIPSGELSKVARSLRLCKRTTGIGTLNVALYAVGKAALLGCGLAGILNLLWVVLGNVLITLLMELNAMRSMLEQGQ